MLKMPHSVHSGDNLTSWSVLAPTRKFICEVCVFAHENNGWTSYRMNAWQWDFQTSIVWWSVINPYRASRLWTVGINVRQCKIRSAQRLWNPQFCICSVKHPRNITFIYTNISRTWWNIGWNYIVWNCNVISCRQYISPKIQEQVFKRLEWTFLKP